MSMLFFGPTNQNAVFHSPINSQDFLVLQQLTNDSERSILNKQMIQKEVS